MGEGCAARSVRSGLARLWWSALQESPLIALLLALALIVVTGLPAALLLDARHAPSRGRLTGLAFLLGSGIVSMVLLALSVGGLSWSRLSVTVALLLVAVALWIAAARVEPSRGDAAPGLTWLDLPAFGVLTVHGFLVARQAVGEWDFWAVWGLKGRVFFELGTIDWAFLARPYNSFQHPDYPPLLPLQYVFVAVHGGAWNDRWLGLITTLFATALLLIVRDALGRELPRPLASLATLGVAAIVATPWVGMAEAPMIAFGGAGLLLLRERRVLLGSLLLGLAAFSKNEGLALIVAAGVALLLVGRARDVLRLWPAALVAAPWLVLRALHGLPADFVPGGFDAARIGLVLRTVARYPPDRPLLWAGLAVVFALFVRSLRRERFLLLACVLQLLFYIAAYLMTPYDVVWHISYSWPRLLDQVAVPLAFAAFTLAGRGIGKQEPASEPVT